jgi:hypothetical protein
VKLAPWLELFSDESSRQRRENCRAILIATVAHIRLRTNAASRLPVVLGEKNVSSCFGTEILPQMPSSRRIPFYELLNPLP